MKDLNQIKKETLHELEELISKINVEDLAEHNKGYLRYTYKEFVLEQVWYWDKVIEHYIKNPRSNPIIDVGTFIPYYPVVLKKLGYDVIASDNTELYSKSYSYIHEYLHKKDIKFIDFKQLYELDKEYDVLLIAVLEHLNGSPQDLMIKIKRVLGKSGELFVLVPNICRFYNILKLVKGESLHPNYTNYYNSKYPFEGHNRTMSMKELEILFKLADFKIKDKGTLSNRPLSETKINLIYNTIGKLYPKFADTIYMIGENNE